jgi:hypothetical protein
VNCVDLTSNLLSNPQSAIRNWNAPEELKGERGKGILVLKERIGQRDSATDLRITNLKEFLT